MGTFLSILGFIFLIIIAKFVYDTYLTNNTERRWQDHVKHNPADKEYFERKFPNHQDSTPRLQYKGFYLYRKETDLPEGSTGVNLYGLFFNEDDAFFFSTTRDYPLQTVIENLPTLFTPQSFAYREAATTFLNLPKINFVNMKFKNVPDMGDLNCSCSLEDKSMIVTMTKDFDINGEVESISFLTKCKFIFHPLGN